MASLNASSAQLVVDLLALAREGSEWVGELAVAQMSRLVEQLAVDNTGELLDAELMMPFRLQGLCRRGEPGEYAVRIETRADVHLCCQRCLEVLPFSLRLDKSLRLAPAGKLFSQARLEALEAEGAEVLPLNGPVVPAELVENEVLLGLPVYPRHENCSVPDYKQAEQGGEVPGPTTSPFKVALSTLRLDH